MSKIIGQALESARAEQRAKLTKMETQRVYDLLEYVAMMADVEIPTEEEEENDEQEV